MGGFRKNIKFKTIAAFIIFQLFFAVITMPLLVFYGPFENVKTIVVGSSWNTLKHQYIVRVFMSEDKIAKILAKAYAEDPFEHGEEIRVINFGEKKDDKIEVYNISGAGFTGRLMVIHNPGAVTVGYSDKIPRLGETTSSIARKNRAVAAINAGGFMDKGWVGTGGAPMGFIIHGGRVIYNQIEDENARQDTVGFTDDGMLIVGRHSIKQLREYGIKEAVSFGPPLIVNGQPTINDGDGGWGIAPRTAIGQKETGEVMFLTIDGRRLDSFGATLKEVQDILLNHGAVNAANLDGGSSTTMYFDGKVINQPSDKLGERAVPSVFMVIPEKGGAD